MKRIMNALMLIFLSLSLIVQFSVPVSAEDQTKTITSDETTIFLKSGEQKQLTYRIEPDDPSAAVHWSAKVMLNDCCSVDDNGLVTAKESGRALIWASIDPHTRVVYTVYVRDQEPEEITNLYLDNSVDGKFVMGKNSEASLCYEIEPVTAEFCPKWFQSSNPDLVQVPDETFGESSAVKITSGSENGFADITLRVSDAITRTIRVYVVDEVPATGISTSEYEIGLHPGESKKISYELKPAGAADTVSWAVQESSETVCEVDEEGNVTGINPGYTTVTGTIPNGESISVDVYVYDDPEQISFNKDSTAIALWDELYFDISTDSWRSLNCLKHYESSNPKVLYVYNEWSYGSAHVYGVGEGTATLTLTAENGKTDSVEVTVKEGIATSISWVDGWDRFMHPGETLQLEYELRPESATEKPVWYVDSWNEKYVSVDENGLVTALRAGTVRVYAKIANGDSISYTVYISEDPSRILFNTDEIILPAGTSVKLQDVMEIKPAAAQNAVLHYESEDENTASVNSGTLYGNAAGITAVTVTSENGVSGRVNVRVIDGYATRIRAAEPIFYLNSGDEKQLEYMLDSSTGNTEKDKVTWHLTKGEDVVSLSEDGKVTVHGYGMAAVQARSALYQNSIVTDSNSSNYVCNYLIYSVKEPVSLHFPASEYYFEAGSNGTLHAIADSPEADYCKRSYVSGSPEVFRIFNSVNGQFYAEQEGTVTLTCTAENGVSAETVIHVLPNSAKGQYSFKEPDESDPRGLLPGDTKDLKPYITVYPNGGEIDFSKMDWELEDESVASVTDGVVTGIAAGNTIISMIDRETKETLTSISVTVNGPVNNFHFERNDYYLLPGDELSLRNILLFEPLNKLFTDVTFTSSDENAVSISRDYSVWTAYGKKEGTAVITAVKSTGETATMTVHVVTEQKEESISYSGSEPFNVHAGYILKPRINIGPETADQNAYFMKSADPSIARISKYERSEVGYGIEGVRPGTTTVTASLVADPTKSITFEVTVLGGNPENTCAFESILREIEPTFKTVKEYRNQEEYTCYVGESYTISASLTWTRLNYLEVPANMFVVDTKYTAENNCIRPLEAGAGWAAGKSPFNSASYHIPFICLREGTVIVNPIGDYTITIHVVNPPGELEELAEEIRNAEDPTETVTFEEPSEEVKEKIDEAINNGETINVELEERTVENISEEDKALIVETISANEETVIDCYDVSLLLKTSESENVIGTIVETNRPITVSLPLSEEAKANGENYKVVRIHGETAEELTCRLSEDGNYIVFQTDKFSTYAVTYEQKKPFIAIYGSSLNLEGKIGINFFLDIPEELVPNAVISMAMGNHTAKVDAAKGIERTIEGKKYLMFTYPVAAKEMRDIVTLTVADQSGNKVKLTKGEEDYTEGYPYSASEYFARAEEVGSEKTKKLNRVLNDYGKYAQIYFDYNVTDEVRNTEDVSAVTLETLEPYKAVMTSEEVTGLTYAGGSTMLDDAIGYRLYFNVEEGHKISEYTFTIDGTEVTPVLRSGNQYYIEKANIAAKDLGVMNEIKVTDGTTTKTIRYGALSYARRVLELTGEDRVPLQNMCRAIYLYNQQAIEYFGN